MFGSILGFLDDAIGLVRSTTSFVTGVTSVGVCSTIGTGVGASSSIDFKKSSSLSISTNEDAGIFTLGIGAVVTTSTRLVAPNAAKNSSTRASLPSTTLTGSGSGLCSTIGASSGRTSSCSIFTSTTDCSCLTSSWYIFFIFLKDKFLLGLFIITTI